jgi:zinc/manganese transport system permease protein
MVNAWLAGTIVAVVAGVVGFFAVMRGSAFVAHAVPQSAFAGAAGASLVGASTLLGLGVFSGLAALGIGLLGRRARHDVVTALAVVTLLGLGSLFLSFSTEYAPETFSLLFGEVLGVNRGEILPIAALGLVCILGIGVLFRPLLLSSVVAEVGEARGVSSTRIEILFLLVMALATTTAVPVVGALLIFSLLIGPPAAARSFTDRPGSALCLSVAAALATVWAAIAAAYASNLPIGFYVGSIGALSYGAGRAWLAWQNRRGPSRCEVWGPAGRLQP